MSKVHHPKHYGGDTTYETIKVLKAWMTPQEFAGFLKGNALKYLSRHREKGGEEDLKKAQWYQVALIDFVDEVGHDTIYPSPDKITKSPRFGVANARSR